jgi:uncharacterized membrane protein
MTSAWKRANWDKWSFWKKVRHVIAVICSVCAVILMWSLFVYLILILFSVEGFLIQFRDEILLQIMREIFG